MNGRFKKTFIKDSDRLAPHLQIKVDELVFRHCAKVEKAFRVFGRNGHSLMIHYSCSKSPLRDEEISYDVVRAK